MPSFINLVKNYYLRLYVSVMIIITLASCFALSKKNALKIYSNKEIQIIHIDTSKMINTNSEKTELKLLGFLGDKIILSSLDNNKIIVLSQSAFNAVELEKK